MSDKYHQRDIVKVYREMPGGEHQVHPFLILSCEAANAKDHKERWYTGVILTHMSKIDQFTYEITPDMIDGRHDGEWSQVRLYIIAGFTHSSISKDSNSFIGRMKPFFFKAILQKIKDYVLVSET